MVWKEMWHKIPNVVFHLVVDSTLAVAWGLTCLVFTDPMCWWKTTVLECATPPDSLICHCTWQANQAPNPFSYALGRQGERRFCLFVFFFAHAHYKSLWVPWINSYQYLSMLSKWRRKGICIYAFTCLTIWLIIIWLCYQLSLYNPWQTVIVFNDCDLLAFYIHFHRYSSNLLRRWQQLHSALRSLFVWLG